MKDLYRFLGLRSGFFSKSFTVLFIVLGLISWQLQAQTVSTYSTPGGPYIYEFTIVSPGTITIQAWGGGGAGSFATGTGNTGESGGGGGGGYSTNTYNVTTPGNYTITVFVGAGGTSVSPNGGNSSYNYSTLITANGGNAGTLSAGGTGGSGNSRVGGNGGNPGGNRGGGGGGSGPGSTNGGTGNAGGTAGTPGGGSGGANGSPGTSATAPGGGGGGRGNAGITSGNGANGQVIITASANVLPVELTSFVAKTKDDMVALNWETASELNNDYFQIEHSRNGVEFLPVGKVRGEGTTSETVQYEFMHRQPLTGTNYYRLKQVDYDGAFEYSDVVVAEVGQRGGDVQVYPNPASDRASIVLRERPEQVKFSFTNLLGQAFDLQPSPSNGGWDIDLSTVPAGIYILRMDYDGQSVTKRIVKK